MSIRLLLIFAITEFLLCLTPGPAVLLLVTYGWAADQGSRLVLKGRFSFLVDRIAGGFLIGAGLGLALTKRL